MAFEGQQAVKLQGAVAGADLRASTTQYKFVKYNGTDNQVVLCNGATDVPCGVLQAPAPSSATGTPVEVLAVGVTKLQQSAAQLSSGNILQTDASAQAKAAVATGYPVGIVMAASNAVASTYITAAINCLSPVVKA